MRIIRYISFLLLCIKSFLSLEIHIIPHSHMDPGWLKTYDEYYNLQVKKIFDNVFEQLKANPNRTFVYCEMEKQFLYIYYHFIMEIVFISNFYLKKNQYLILI